MKLRKKFCESPPWKLDCVNFKLGNVTSGTLTVEPSISETLITGTSTPMVGVDIINHGINGMGA
jgi:hypothetical protein